jgi:hypothetical protein
MEVGFPGGAFGLMMMLGWAIPLAAVIITLMLAIRLVRAAERIANAAEGMARNAQPHA